MIDNSNLAWGLKDAAPAGVPTLGARAILENGRVDFLADRCDRRHDGTDAGIERFNELAYWTVDQAQFLSCKLDPRRGELFTVYSPERGFHCALDTKGSCGYVYLTAWIEE